MIAWLWDIIVGRLCLHQWDEIKAVEIFTTGESMKNNLPIRTDYHLRCNKCGNMKKVKL